MTQALSDVARTDGGRGAEIRPFKFTVPNADVADLRRRVNATKWPEREGVTDSSAGVPLRTMQNLARSAPRRCTRSPIRPWASPLG